MRRVRIGAGLLLVLALLSLLAPLLAQHGPNTIPEGSARLGPSWDHWFGTDQLGRDLFARVLYGGRTSLVIGICAALLGGFVGVLVGAIAGYRGGWVDNVLMRATEVVLVFPSIVFAGILVIALGRGVGTVIIVLGLMLSPVVARVCRSSVLEVRHAQFVEAARASGCKTSSIIRRHVLPHALGPVVVLVTLSVGTAILAESTLSFLSVGVTEPTASWGLMISGGRRFLSSSPHIVLFPAGAIFLTVVAFVVLADGARDVLNGSKDDPRS